MTNLARVARPSMFSSGLRRVLLAGIAACAMVSAMAGQRTPTPAVLVDDAHFRNYGVRDGLSQASAKTLLQDATGAVWIGTQDGLNRFDGYEFKVYRADPERQETLPDSHVQVLAASRRGGFWVGTRAAGIALYRPELDSFVRFPTATAAFGGESNAVVALQETADGRLWIGNSGEGLHWLDPADDSFHGAPEALNRQLGPVAAFGLLDGQLLAGGQDGVWLVDPSGQTARRWGPSGAELRVEAIAVSPNQREVWIGTRFSGVYRFDRQGRELGHWGPEEGLPHVTVRDIKFDHEGRLWISTLEGLARFDSPAVPLKVWTYGTGLGDSLSSDRLMGLMVDRDGLVWVGSLLKGASVIAPRSQVFKEIQVRSPSSRGGGGSAVGTFLIEPNGALWISAAEGLGVVHYDPHRGVIGHFSHEPGNPRSLPSNIVVDFKRDRRGRVWVATAEGLARMEGDGFKVYRHDPKAPGSLPSPNVLTLLEDRDGAMWVGTLGGGVGRLCDGCDHFRVYGAKPGPDGQPGLGSNSVEAMHEDRHGAIWIGLRSGGLVRLDPKTERIVRYRARPGVPGFIGNDSVSWISEDRQGRLWVGHGAGVSWARTDGTGPLQFQNIRMNAVGAVVQDDDGHHWVSTTVGISRIDADTGAVTHYSSRDGAQMMGYFIGAAGKFPDGRIAFGGLNGITVFDPRKVVPAAPPHRVALTDLHAAGAGSAARTDIWRQWMTVGQQGREVVLPPEAGNFALEFSAMTFADPAHLVYAYRMDGIDDDWVEVDAVRRLASYTNLDPGHYTFRVRARDAHGAWGPELVVPLRLMPPWWRTWGAYLTYAMLVALVLGGVAWAFRVRLAERKRAQREIADSEQRLKLALWGTGDELWDLDLTRGELHRQNPLDSTEGMGEESVADIHAIRDQVHPDDLEAYDAAVAAYAAGTQEFIEVSYRMLDPSGQWRWLLSRGRVVTRSASGRPTRVIGTNSDITRLKDNEMALAKVNAELETRVRVRTEALHASNESLHRTIDELRDTQNQLVESEKMAALGGLVAGVAHEINTPLGVGVTAASFLEQQASSLATRIADGSLDRAGLEAFSQAARDSSQLILRNLQRADRMVKSFKQVAVDQSSEAARRIELPGYLEEVLVSLQPALRQRRHEVVIDCPTPIAFETYPGAIYQIISNLVMNSVVHGFADREQGRIRIAVSADEHDLFLRYEDDGCGMSEEARRRVFEPFFTTRRGSGGSGLGMHIVWNLATQVLGGGITCSAPEVRGTRFDLRIPRQLRPRKEHA
ncbi:two-component regulator propeller domain-containing protein [Lysobacter olei]